MRLLKAILVSLTLLLAAPTFAENPPTRQMPCYSVEAMEQILTKAGEKVIFFDKNKMTRGQTLVALTVNTDTGTWTLLEVYKDKACVLGSGQSQTV
jgi:hypothetical protein